MWLLILKNAPALVIGAVVAITLTLAFDSLVRIPRAEDRARAEIRAETLERATDLVRDLDKTKAATSAMTDAQLCEKLKGTWDAQTSTCN